MQPSGKRIETVNIFNAARRDHVSAKMQRLTSTCVHTVERKASTQTRRECRGIAWLKTRLAITIKDKYKLEMLKRHDLWRIFDGERTVIWCRRCAGYASHLVGKHLKHRCRGHLEEERHCALVAKAVMQQVLCGPAERALRQTYHQQFHCVVRHVPRSDVGLRQR